ncbi:MAG: AraC family transcriptional regulator [Sphingobium sp.]
MVMINVREKQGTIRSSMLTDYARLSTALGIDAVSQMHRVGIDKRYLDDSDLVLPISAVVDLLEQTALQSGIYDFGLRLAEMRGLPDLGPVNLMVREEETVRGAVHALIDFMHLHSDAGWLNFEDDGSPFLTVNIMGCSANSQRQAMDMSIAQLVSIIRWLLGDRWSPESICFTHSRPLSMTRYSHFFRCPIDFLHEFNGIVMAKNDLDRKLMTSSPALRRQVERYVKSLPVSPRDMYAKRVQKLVTLALPRGEAKVEMIAASMNTTSRTLNRKLAKTGINFSGVLEVARKELAIQFLVDDERPISDIAGMVGFNSLSAFSTWFKQAFQCTPREWRKAHQGFH